MDLDPCTASAPLVFWEVPTRDPNVLARADKVTKGKAHGAKSKGKKREKTYEKERRTS
jgi:hypothetical protein